MVIILHHTLAALYYYHRDKERFLVDTTRRASGVMGLNEGVQEATLRLGAVVTWAELEDALKEALQLVLPKVSDVVVYLQASDGRPDLVSNTGLRHTLPKEGLAWEALQKRRRILIPGLEDADPLSGLIKAGNPSNGGNRKVACCPVEDKESDKVIAVFIVVCDELSKEDHLNLTFIEKQLLVCHKRLQATSRLHHNANDTKQSANDTRQISGAKMEVEVAPELRPTQSDLLALCGNLTPSQATEQAELFDEDPALLQVKVIKYLIRHTEAESGFSVLVSPEQHELVLQVIGGDVLEDEIRFPLDEQNSFSAVIKSKKPMQLNEFDEIKKARIEEMTGSSLRSLLCVPAINQNSERVDAIMCIVNKKHQDKFTDHDIDVVQQCFAHTSAVLNSTISAQHERMLKKRTQTMLQVAKNLFTQLDNLTNLLREIMQEARNLTQAERCSVFLLERETNELVAKVFDGDIRKEREVSITKLLTSSHFSTLADLLEEEDQPKMTTEIRIPADSGIAGYVATTGEILNIDDAYSHELFYRGVDESTGFRTRNILCFPIKDETGVIIGVAQLCNKINGASFTSFDEDIAQAFSIYCCISIVHSLMYKRVRDAQIRSHLSNELMIYHMQVAPEDVTALELREIPNKEFFSPEFQMFQYIPRNLPYDDTPMAVLSMAKELGFFQKFRICQETMCRFVLMVRRGYRDPPYHNWAHAFAVAHFCYLLHQNLGLINYLDDVEVFALFIACLCHDIDHRGTTNSYQVKSGSVLSALYSSEGSVMERHHFAQTMCILNTNGCNIFENVSSKDYERILDLMRDIILATDLAHHLRIIKELDKMAGEYDKSNKRHHMLLLCLLMTSCDLSDQTKNWKNTKKIANLIYQEFFSQGDLEKSIGTNPVEMMDREKAYIPELQLHFLDDIALPVFRILSKMFSGASVVQERVEKNRENWERMNDKVQQLQCVSNSMDIFNLDINIEEEDGES